MVNTELLSTFLEVAKFKSLRVVAQRICLSQPALTKRIKNLEEQTGRSLFLRKRSGMEPNDFGKALLEHCKGYAKELEGVQGWIDAQQGKISGQIFISCPSTFMSYILPSFLKEFLKKYPNVFINVSATISQVTEDRILKGDANIGVLIGRSVKRSLKIQELCDSPMVIVCSPDHPLAQKKKVTRDDIVKHRMIWFASAQSRSVRAILAHMGLGYEQTEGLRVSDLEAAKLYAVHGLGLAIMSLWQLQEELKSKKLIILKGFSMNRPFTMISRSEKYESPTVSLFKKELVAYCRALKCGS